MRSWLQISAGTGPLECARAVALALGRVQAEASACGARVAVLETVPASAPGTLRSALLALEGPGVERLCQAWAGTLCWTAPSPFRPQCRRKNWFIGVTVLAPPQGLSWGSVEFHCATFRSSGPGGQHVNKAETAVRARHPPTGLVAVAREERSQSANRRLALARLWARLEAKNKAGEGLVQLERWREHRRLERGEARRRFLGPRFEEG